MGKLEADTKSGSSLEVCDSAGDSQGWSVRELLEYKTVDWRVFNHEPIQKAW